MVRPWGLPPATAAAAAAVGLPTTRPLLRMTYPQPGALDAARARAPWGPPSVPKAGGWSPHGALIVGVAGEALIPNCCCGCADPCICMGATLLRGLFNDAAAAADPGDISPAALGDAVVAVAAVTPAVTEVLGDPIEDVIAAGGGGIIIEAGDPVGIGAGGMTIDAGDAGSPATVAAGGTGAGGMTIEAGEPGTMGAGGIIIAAGDAANPASVGTVDDDGGSDDVAVAAAAADNDDGGGGTWMVKPSEGVMEGEGEGSSVGLGAVAESSTKVAVIEDEDADSVSSGTDGVVAVLGVLESRFFRRWLLLLLLAALVLLPLAVSLLFLGFFFLSFSFSFSFSFSLSAVSSGSAMCSPASSSASSPLPSFFFFGKRLSFFGFFFSLSFL